VLNLFSLGILDGRIYLDGQWVEGNLYIKDGRIAAISGSYLESAEEYDTKGKCVLPGFIDPHVHFNLNVGKYTSADDFNSGSISAAFGGITTYIDFLDPIYKADDIEKAFERRRFLSKDSVIDYGFHATLSNPEDEPSKMIEKMKNLGIPSAKFFTAYSSSNRNTSDKYLDQMMKISKEKSILMLVHAENEGILTEGKNIRIASHENARPAVSEISEVIKLAEMAKYNEGLLYIVHVSCGTTVERLKEIYGNILNRTLFIESCPHYFTFNSGVYEDENGGLFTMTPPLRSEKERKALVSNIDSVYTIGTDHCPFDSKYKRGEFTADIPMGIGGIEHSFSIMYSLFGNGIIDKFTKNAAKVHGLYPRKGTLLPGSDADVVIFDSQCEWKVNEHNSKCDYVAYKGITLKGKVQTTISRGKFIVKDEKFQGGKGEYIAREGVIC
jgi:dihydropyrimidinase